jgi:hypothetical protein
LVSSNFLFIVFNLSDVDVDLLFKVEGLVCIIGLSFFGALEFILQPINLLLGLVQLVLQNCDLLLITVNLGNIYIDLLLEPIILILQCSILLIVAIQIILQ